MVSKMSIGTEAIEHEKSEIATTSQKPLDIITCTKAENNSMTSLSSSTEPDAEQKFIAEPDFEEEYERINEISIFLADAISNKNIIASAIASIEEYERQLEELPALYEAALVDAKKKHTKFDEFATLNIERQEKWAQLGVKADDAKFICDHVKRRKYVHSELEKQIILAEENATLFKERLQITILARSSVEADCRVHKLCEEIEEADVKLQAFKKQLVEARMTYRATVLEWIGKQQLSKPSTQPTEHESSTSDVAERDARIDALEKQVKEQEDQLKAKDGTVQSLEAKISASEPIQAVGLHALRRRRELQKPRVVRDHAMIEVGNWAVHRGSCLADAARVCYHDQDAAEKVWYEVDYGLSASFALEKVRPSSLYLERVLDWHSAVQGFDVDLRWTSSPNGGFLGFKNNFQKFKNALNGAKLENGFNLWIEAYFTKDEDGKKVYEEMKKIYEGRLEKHREWRKSR